MKFIVKYLSGSAGVDAIYGPMPDEVAQWLLIHFCEGVIYTWQAVDPWALPEGLKELAHGNRD